MYEGRLQLPQGARGTARPATTAPQPPHGLSAPQAERRRGEGDLFARTQPRRPPPQRRRDALRRRHPAPPRRTEPRPAPRPTRPGRPIRGHLPRLRPPPRLLPPPPRRPGPDPLRLRELLPRRRLPQRPRGHRVLERRRLAPGLPAARRPGAPPPRSRFLVAGEAWRAIREHGADERQFGLHPPEDGPFHGERFVAGNIRLDLAALNKVETLLWDVWGEDEGEPGQPLRRERGGSTTRSPRS